ncbi:DUF1214 domain-containing protein [Piscinibacter gummiphilus]|nr:DUF1254 domain-containing protein [Piscinibacter gummiphilus]
MMRGLSICLFVGVTTAAQAQIFPPEDEANATLVRSRASQAVIWGMPAVNTDLMLQQMLDKTPGRMNQLIYWGRPLDSRNQTLTPNPDTLYVMAFFDTRQVGPVVLEVPRADAGGSLTGNTMTMWQTALEDVGVLGVDRGKGGRFVILPPGHAGKVPVGFTPLKADTHTTYALLRVNMTSHAEADVQKAVAYARRIRVYPLAQASKPPATVISDVKDIEFDSTIRYDLSFFRSLHRVVQAEPWIERDRAMIDVLRTVGIEKGKPFSPNDAVQKALLAGAADAKAALVHRYDQGFAPFFSASSHWTNPTHQEAIEGQGSNYGEQDKYPVDARGLLYTYGYISIKRPGTAQFYLISIRDKEGQPFHGSRQYRLRVPAGAPVEQYWSVTAYDRETHALIKGMSRASRSSQIADMPRNADGSVDVYFGPTAPAGKERSWVPTDPTRGFELMFRVYGPKKEFFEKRWVLPDVEAAP